MGRQLAFWKYDDGVYLDNSKVYETVCIEGTTIKGLSNLPISDILKKVKDTFSNYNQLDEFNYENSDAAFSIETTEQSIMFTYGSVDNVPLPSSFVSDKPQPPQTGTGFTGSSEHLIPEYNATYRK